MARARNSGPIDCLTLGLLCLEDPFVAFTHFPDGETVSVKRKSPGTKRRVSVLVQAQFHHLESGIMIITIATSSNSNPSQY